MVQLFYIVHGLAIFFTGAWTVNFGMQLVAILNGKLTLHKKGKLPKEPLPGVSILKPLTGVDKNLFTNLESFFTMNYPKYELLFCLECESDPAIMLVKKLMEKYPDIDARVFIGAPRVGVNPKVNNMNPGFEAAKYDLVLVSDCGIRMREDTLQQMVCTMTPDMAMVHQMPFLCDRGGVFPDNLEKVYFGSYVSRIYLVHDMFSMNWACGICGMSSLMRKKLLDEAGGMKAFGNYLSEDLFFAKSFLERGWTIRISPQTAWQNSGICKIEQFYDRVSRWTKLCFAMDPFNIPLEPFSHCLPVAVGMAFAVNLYIGFNVVIVFLVVFLVWITLDWILLSVIQNEPLPFSKLEFFYAWAFLEIRAFYQFCVALWNPEIEWRTRTFRLQWGGIAEEVKMKL